MLAPAANGLGSTASLWSEFKAKGDAVLREQLFDKYAPFAKRVARKHYSSRAFGRIDLGDIYQLAYAGLLEAIDRFEPVRGASFEGYAVRRITGSIVDGISKYSELDEQVTFLSRLRRERIAALKSELNLGADGDDAMAALAEVAVALAIGFMLDGTNLYIASERREAQRSAYDAVEWGETLRKLTSEVERLPPREAKLVKLHYQEGLSFTDIGLLLGVSKGRVSQVHKSALTNLAARLRQSQTFSFGG